TRNEAGAFCSTVLGPNFRGLPHIDHEDVAWLSEHLLRPLNAQVRLAAKRNRWTLVAGVESAFRDHGYCARDSSRWVVRLGESIKRLHGLTGTLHPNHEGHEHTADLIFASLLASLYPHGRPWVPRTEDAPPP